jgi:hypothetical protein
LERLDSLVRKSLVLADQSGGAARYTLLETIRQFAEDQLAAAGTSDETRDRHARYFASKEGEILALWNSPDQRRAYDWLGLELPNLRAGFRWAADRGDLDTAAPIAILDAYIGFWDRRFEPIDWCAELLAAAGAADHRRLVALYVMASLCCFIGRADDAVRHGEAALALIGDPRYDAPPFGYIESWVSLAYLYAGRTDRYLELNRAEVRRSGDPFAWGRSNIVNGLVIIGHTKEAMALADEAVAAAEGTANPTSLAWALGVYGRAFIEADPMRALAAHRRGLSVARESGNRFLEAANAVVQATLEAEHGDPRTALDLFVHAINSFHDSGDTLNLGATFAHLAMSFDRAGHHEAAARLCGTNKSSVPDLPGVSAAVEHLREVLGEAVFDRLTREGAAMERADAVRYAHAEIQRAREELSKSP